MGTYHNGVRPLDALGFLGVNERYLLKLRLISLVLGLAMHGFRAEGGVELDRTVGALGDVEVGVVLLAKVKER